MKLGILSDTHGKAAVARAAVDLLKSHGAEYFIHCGDIGTFEVLDQLAGLSCTVVFGNTDFDRSELGRYANDLGINSADPWADVSLAGKRIAVTHGDDGALVRKLLDAQAHDYLLTGHTHIPADSRFKRTRAINPGALFRASRKTVGLLDLLNDKLTMLEVTAG